VLDLVEKDKPVVEWEALTTWEVGSLSLSSKAVSVGHPLQVTAVVENTGAKPGMAEVELQVNGVSSSREVPLLPGENKSVQFIVAVPKPGTYTVMAGNLTERFEVINR